MSEQTVVESELQLKEEVGGAVAVAKSLVIVTADDFSLADTRCKALLELKKKIEKDFEKSKGAAHSAWKAIVAQEKGHLDGVEEARGIYKRGMDTWSREQEKLRQAEQRRLEDEARKLAEKEQLEAAVAAEEAGEPEEVETILAQPVQAAPVYVPKAVPKTTTVIRRIPDLNKIEAAVANGKRSIPGVHIYQAWHFKVIESKDVPDEYKRPS